MDEEYVLRKSSCHLSLGFPFQTCQIDLSLNQLGPAGAKELAPAIAVCASLTQVLAFLCLKPSCTDCTLPHALTKRQVNLSLNNIHREGKAALQEAVKEKQGFTLEL